MKMISFKQVKYQEKSLQMKLPILSFNIMCVVIQKYSSAIFCFSGPRLFSYVVVFHCLPLSYQASPQMVAWYSRFAS